MAKLSININKIALLRNSRGRNFPNVCTFASRFLTHGVHGITLHPRSDQRHACYQDVYDLSQICNGHGKELNVEGYPSQEFLNVVKRARPTQCTLVPDSPDQLTSDHGWNLDNESEILRPVIAELKGLGIRVSLFVDFDCPSLELARDVGADRIELYTGPYADHYGSPEGEAIFQGFCNAAKKAQEIGLGVNAGHDLNLQNLQHFLEIPEVLEVSIGHAFLVECIEYGLEKVATEYLKICQR